MQLTIMCGFGMYYAWYLIAFFGLFMNAPGEIDFVALHTGQVVFFIGSVLMAGALLAWFHRTDSVAIGHTRFLYLGSLVPGLALPALVVADAFGASVPTAALYTACLLCGASVAVGFTLWEDVTTHGRMRQGVLAHGVIFCAGGVAFALCTSFLSQAHAAIAAIALLCASTALLAFITPRCDFLENRPVKPVRDHFRKVWHIDLVVGVINMAFGFAFMLLYQADNTLLLATMCLALFVNLAYSIAFGRGKWVQFAGWARICTAFVACALLLFICPNEVPRTIALCVIVVFWFLFRTMNGGSLTDLANYHDYSALYSSVRGKMPANVGFLLGLTLGVCAVAANSPALQNLYIPLALIAAFVLISLFFLPFDNESSTPGYKTLTLVEMRESPNDDMERSCELVTSRYKLSPRESEVLVYLVKGRNAKHVAEKLFISESTAKTHISNIYRKLGIHSQQELLDAVDGMDYRPPGKAR